MSRRYLVDQRNADGRLVTTVLYDRPQDAMASFKAALAGAGHDDAAVQRWLNTWTCVLMTGGHSVSAFDPDLDGFIEITVDTTGHPRRVKEMSS